VISRDDLALEQAAFMRVWRTSLLSLQKECNENVLYFQTCLTQDRVFPRIKKEKTRALISSLLLLEVSYLRVVEELLNCKSLESATELWAGRYQLRFQYNKKERYKYSPVEISLGSINIPYGMEYAGTNTHRDALCLLVVDFKPLVQMYLAYCGPGAFYLLLISFWC